MNSDDIREIDGKIEEYIARDDQGLYNCTFCGKTGERKRSNIKNHIETHLEGLSFLCQLCGKNFRSRNQLFKHKHYFHK